MNSNKWLKIWIEIGVVLSGVDLFEAQLSSCAYQVLFFGVDQNGLTLHEWDPDANYDYFDTLASIDFIYNLGILLGVFASFVCPIRKFLTLKQPYRVPFWIPLLVVMCLLMSAFFGANNDDCKKDCIFCYKDCDF
ncbi:hypothetical protein Ccrd_007117 [Cynara cardunculus var. scolymus]|uniref:Uncharacterized protein n=1 Tax=Cynara cardunculus var. scolymus TaxID=59895 RepID=A0A103XHN9_CYNCS|nr:hypothetical protein Ccrd_007117 [Cynara cardunculus var. scolymus]